MSANVCVRERWQEGEGGREQLHGQGDWSVEASDAKYTKRIAMRIGERPKVRDSRLEVGRGSRIITQACPRSRTGTGTCNCN